MAILVSAHVSSGEILYSYDRPKFQKYLIYLNQTMKIKLYIKKIQKYFKYLFQPKYVLYQFESYRTKYLNTYLFRYILEILGVKKKGLTSRHARPRKHTRQAS